MVRRSSEKKDGEKTKSKVAAKSDGDGDGAGQIGIDTARLKRVKPSKSVAEEEEEVVERTTPASVSAGPVDKVIELAFNPSRDKIREVTIIDRMQGRLFPIMDAMNTLFGNCLEIAMYRQSRADYRAAYGRIKPKPLDIMDELMFRTAQWQKSVAGKNLERATDIALAETETREPENEDYSSSGGRGFDD